MDGYRGINPIEAQRDIGAAMAARDFGSRLNNDARLPPWIEIRQFKSLKSAHNSRRVANPLRRSTAARLRSTAA
jgi:hypothetical protein